MTWTWIDVPAQGDEATLVVGFLERQRELLTWKTEGLDAAALDVTTAASTMTLGGLLKHMAVVEAYWFLNWWSDEPKGEPWDSADWAADRDWEWHSAADDSPDELRALWQSAVERSRALVTDALARGGLDQLAAHRADDPQHTPTLRWILLHLIEEYARHIGHADLLREVIDGQVGEDPLAQEPGET